MKFKNIEVILFDSGRVLNKPSSGHWFIPPNFYQYVEKDKFNDIEKKKISNAFKKANDYISMQKSIPDKDSEYKHFLEYYKIFAQNLLELNLTNKQIEMIAKDLVYNAEKYSFYDDALHILPKLSEKYRLGIISDAWPSLIDVYADKKLDKYFECFVISSYLGITKPDLKMYQTSLDELKVAPQKTIFIDDNLDNVQGAMKLGINGVLLCRNKWNYYWNKLISIGKSYVVINNLNEINELIVN